MSDYGMATFEPPPEVEQLIIFADHDGAGQRAAANLAERLLIPTKIKMPDEPGTDWNDVLVRR